VLRLLPSPSGEITVAEAYDDPQRRATAVARQRPWVQLCMVSSIDGSTQLDGRSGGLAGPTDGEVLRYLRRSADVVLVGAGTVRDEHYRPREGVRIAVVSRSLNVDWSRPLWSDANTFVVTTVDAPAAPSGANVIRCGHGNVDLPLALQQLHDHHHADVVQCEGGPTLNAAMMAADCIDEVCLTIGARVVGGTGTRLVHGALEFDHRYALQQVAIADNDLYLRYLRA
jgi:riboflavin biosynthesis pyrimidine reductase